MVSITVVGNVDVDTLEKPTVEAPPVEPPPPEGEPPPDGDAKEKVTICHNPGPNQRTIEVAPEAVPAHLAQGAYLGACEPWPEDNDGATEPSRPGRPGR